MQETWECPRCNLQNPIGFLHCGRTHGCLGKREEVGHICVSFFYVDHKKVSRGSDISGPIDSNMRDLARQALDEWLLAVSSPLGPETEKGNITFRIHLE